MTAELTPEQWAPIRDAVMEYGNHFAEAAMHQSASKADISHAAALSALQKVRRAIEAAAGGQAQGAVAPEDDPMFNFNNIKHVSEWLADRGLLKLDRCEETDRPLAVGLNITDSIAALLATPPAPASPAEPSEPGSFADGYQRGFNRALELIAAPAPVAGTREALSESTIYRLMAASEVYQYHPGAGVEFVRAIERAHGIAARPAGEEGVGS